MDKLTKERRSWLMSRVRSRHTKPELVVRSLLHRCGYRFSLRNAELPGRPDLKLNKYRSVVFVNGCFWHRHPGCPKASTPKTNRSFWLSKFKKNVERDRRNFKKLKEKGWSVIVVWECEIKKEPLQTLGKIIQQLHKTEMRPKRSVKYSDLDEREILQVAESKLQYSLSRTAVKKGRPKDVDKLSRQ